MFIAALPLLASAWTENILLGRSTSGNSTSCSTNDKVCGAFCIPSDYTCCPDLEGGCSADSTCQKGDNDVYGCCPDGDTCTGDGGAEYIEDATPTSSGAVSTKTTDSQSGADGKTFSPGLAVAVVAVLLYGL
jgi:hypothetical protein